MNTQTKTTELDLDAIEARVNAATPGPWIGPTYRQVLAGLATSTGGHYVDAPFIRHAREDVPALVAEVRRLREVLDQITRMCDCRLGDLCPSAIAHYALNGPTA